MLAISVITGVVSATGMGGLEAPKATADAALPTVTFADGTEIYTVGADGSGLHTWRPQLNDVNSAQDWFTAPVASPDGRRIAVLDGVMDGLLLTNPDGSQTRTFGGRKVDPAWSPDGSYLYYAAENAPTAGAVTVARQRADGGDQEALFTVHKAINSLGVTPSGDVVYFDGAIHVWHAADGSTTTITPQLPAGMTVTGVAVSPDGTRLAVATLNQSATPATPDVSEPLFLCDVSGANAKLLTYGSDPAWSPDGTRLAVVGHVGAPSGVWTLNADGSGRIRVSTRIPHSAPTWQSVPWTGPSYSVDRMGGADRVDTAIAASRRQFAGSGARADALHHAQVAVLSRDDTYADALAGSAFAAARRGPLLLTDPARLDARVVEELRRTLPAHATVYLLGGVNALSSGVEDQVRAAGFAPVRIWGQTRYDTAVAVAEVTTTSPAAVFLATGNDFPDALTAGAAAGAVKHGIVLLTDGRTMPAVVSRYLAGHRPQLLTTVGGAADAAWSTDRLNGGFNVAGSGVNIHHIVGTDRFDTARQLATDVYIGGFAQWEAQDQTALGGHMPDSIAVATGLAWPDALAGGTIAALNYAPLLLSDKSGVPASEAELYESVPSSMLQAEGGPNTILVFGGPNAVTDAAVTAFTALTGHGGWRITSRF